MTLSTENYVKNPFNFKRYTLSEIYLHLDGLAQPVKTLKPNFDNQQYIQAYMSLFSRTDKKTETKATILHAKTSLTDLRKDLDEEGHFNMVVKEPFAYN